MFVEETFIGCLMTFADVLHRLRADLAPITEALRFHPQSADMFKHMIEGDVFAKQTVVTSLQSRQVIPDDARDVDRIIQRSSMIACVQAIFVGSTDVCYDDHALNPYRLEVGGCLPHHDQHCDSTQHLFEIQIAVP